MHKYIRARADTHTHTHTHTHTGLCLKPFNADQNAHMFRKCRTSSKHITFFRRNTDAECIGSTFKIVPGDEQNPFDGSGPLLFAVQTNT
jgi:hypothetical protein